MERRRNLSNGSYMCDILLGTISLSGPTKALPVARMRFSPFAVSGMSLVPVWRPLRDHSVSPWRMMKTRGVGIGEGGKLGAGGSWKLRKEDRERTTTKYREFEESNQSSRIQPVRQATASLI